MSTKKQTKSKGIFGRSSKTRGDVQKPPSAAAPSVQAAPSTTAAAPQKAPAAQASANGAPQASNRPASVASAPTTSSTPTANGASQPAAKAQPSARQDAAINGRASQPSFDERQKMIADAAYYRAEQRGFAPGYELEDWVAAERQISSLLSSN